MLDFSNSKILIVGDVMLDKYYFGKVDRISPEAPVPIVNIQKEESRLGGASGTGMYTEKDNKGSYVDVNVMRITSGFFRFMHIPMLSVENFLPDNHQSTDYRRKTANRPGRL